MKIQRNVFCKIAELGVVLTAIGALILAGCSAGSGGVTNGAGAGGAGGSISGIAVLGPAGSATVTAYAVDSTGLQTGSALGSATTSATGEFSISISSIPASPILLVVSGGSYISEADGSTITVTKPIHSLLASVSTGGVSGVAITPLSDMAEAHAIAHAASGVALSTAISNADTFISTTFNLGAQSPSTITPDFTAVSLTSKTAGSRLALAIAALEGLATRIASGVTGISRADVYASLSADYSDGVPDGKNFAGATVTISASTGSASLVLPTTSLGYDYAGELAAVKPAVFVGAGAASAIAVEAAVGGTLATSAVPVAVAKLSGLSSSSSGAMSYASIGGHQYLFIAARQKGVRKIDVTDPASPIEMTAPAWKGAALATDTGFGTSPATIGGATVVSASTGVQILAFAYGAKHIALLDPGTGAITYEGNLPLVASPISFSGTPAGGAYITGAIPDPGKGAWLATADGYVYLDINATLAAGAGAAPVLGTTKFVVPAGTSSGSNALAENLGGDIGKSLLFTPNYGGLSLQVVANQTGGLAAGTYLLDPTYRAASATVASGNMDGGSVDTGLGVGIISYEDTGNISFINLNSIAASAVPAGTTAGTFVPPSRNGFVDVPIGGGTFSGTAVDSKTHQVLGMAGFSASIMVGQLQDPATVAAGAWVGMSDWVYCSLTTYLPSYAYAQDPHANVTVYNTKTGKTYAYVLDGATSPTGVVQIDVSGLLAMSHPSHLLAANPTTTGVITEITLP